MAAVQLLHLFFFFLTLPFLSSSFDVDALLKLKQSFNNTDSLSSWVPSRWAGIMCDNNTIIGLHLSDMGLSSNINIDVVLEIKGLRTVSLVNNSFPGPIPNFNRVGALKALYLSTHQFSGQISLDYFSYLNSLKKIWLSDNKFSGPIPDSISQLDNLTEIHLENNEFTGSIPQLTQNIKSQELECTYGTLECALGCGIYTLVCCSHMSPPINKTEHSIITLECARLGHCFKHFCE